MCLTRGESRAGSQWLVKPEEFEDNNDDDDCADNIDDGVHGTGGFGFELETACARSG
jgi:hypothetical protein